MALFEHKCTRFLMHRLDSTRKAPTWRETSDPRARDIAFVCVPEFVGPEGAADRMLQRLVEVPSSPAIPGPPPAWVARLESEWRLPLRPCPDACCDVAGRDDEGAWQALLFHEAAPDCARGVTREWVLPDGIAPAKAAEELADAGGAMVLQRTLCTLSMDDHQMRALQSTYAQVGWIFVVPKVNDKARAVLAVPNLTLPDAAAAPAPTAKDPWWSGLVGRALGLMGAR